jgi:hypothetical protein
MVSTTEEQAYGLHIRRTTYNPLESPVRIGGLICLPKHEGARDNKFLITLLMTDHCKRCLTSAIADQAH